MRIKKFLNPTLLYTIFVSIVVMLSITSCKKYLEVDPKTSGQVLSANYYQDSTQCYAALAAAYTAVRINCGGFYGQISSINPASDDHYAGGGGAADGGGLQNVSNWTLNQTNIGDNTSGPAYMWYNYYIGINNANILLSKLEKSGISEGLKKRMAAECKTLRAYYYFNLVRVWGNIPLMMNSVSANAIYSVKQATPAEVYAQIEKDLKEAIPNLPTSLSADEAGRVTQGAAKSLLGKVYLYEGDGIPGKGIQGDATKYALAATIFAEVTGGTGTNIGPSPYGYQLLSKYKDLWSDKVNNASPLFSNHPGRFNAEAIFEDVHTNKGLTGWGNWSSGSDMGNMMCTLVGPRGYKVKDPSTNPFTNFSTVGAWSFSIITPDAYAFMQKNKTNIDSRMEATILNMHDWVEKGWATYEAGYQNTEYFLYKFLPLVSDESSLGGDKPLNFAQSGYIIRLADVYLMEAEALLKSGGDLGRALALVNAVRSRAGANLLTGTVTLQQIWDERRMELMGEGHRFFDLVRTGQSTTNAELLRRGFTPGKNEWYPIPYKEMQNPNFKQNSGYN